MWQLNAFLDLDPGTNAQLVGQPSTPDAGCVVTGAGCPGAAAAALPRARMVTGAFGPGPAGGHGAPGILSAHDLNFIHARSNIRVTLERAFSSFVCRPNCGRWMRDEAHPRAITNHVSRATSIPGSTA